MVATKKQKYKEILGTGGTSYKYQHQNQTNITINELGPKIWEKTAEKAYKNDQKF